MRPDLTVQNAILEESILLSHHHEYLQLLQSVTVFENTVLKRMLGLKRDKVTGCQRKVHNEFHNLHYLPSIIKDM
jgi:hypothetical protein